jgi:hypothetical protein
MGWSQSTAVAMSMRYGHLFAARDEHLTQALERVYRAARRPNDGQQAPDRPVAFRRNRPLSWTFGCGAEEIRTPDLFRAR